MSKTLEREIGLGHKRTDPESRAPVLSSILGLQSRQNQHPGVSVQGARHPILCDTLLFRSTAVF